jgi:hypothetical protein
MVDGKSAISFLFNHLTTLLIDDLTILYLMDYPFNRSTIQLIDFHLSFVYKNFP